MSSVIIQVWGQVDGNLGSATTVENEVGKGLEQEATVVTAEQGLGQDGFAIEGYPPVELLVQLAPTALAPTLSPIEEFQLSQFWRELVLVPLDHLEM